MPLPRWLARANKAGLNRVSVKVAPWFPPLEVAVHRGRRSGRQMRSPRVYHDVARSGIRPVERQVLKLLGTADFLYLETMR